MAKLLLLTHRLPYPPDKGDKIHAFHLLQHLTRRHEVSLGTFVDDPRDEQHVPTVQRLCSDLHVARLRPAQARWRAARALLRGESVTVSCYRDEGLMRWVKGIADAQRADTVLVHSSAMLQYAQAVNRPLLADLNDVDSAKWQDYGERRAWPMSWVYRRESRRLQQTEREAGALARWSLFATEREAGLFRSLVPQSASRVGVLGNGVDARHFEARPDRVSPYAGGEERPLVFVGTMDYWPNVDAVNWFARDVLPGLRQRWPRARLYVVGRNPSAAVRALASESVQVVGAVADTRPWLQHAALMVAPMRLVRGIQNKVLEAMAMGLPVLTTRDCAASIEARPGEHLAVGDSAAELTQQADALLADPAQARRLGLAGRNHILSLYDWTERMARLDRYLADTDTHTDTATGATA